MSKCYLISRVAVAGIWLYHGLIPKLIFCHPSEVKLVEAGPWLLSPEMTVRIAGGVEVLVGVLVLLAWNHRWPMWFSMLAFSVLLLGAMSLDPNLVTEAFNPVTTSLSAVALAAINVSCGETNKPSADSAAS